MGHVVSNPLYHSSMLYDNNYVEEMREKKTRNFNNGKLVVSYFLNLFSKIYDDPERNSLVINLNPIKCSILCLLIGRPCTTKLNRIQNRVKHEQTFKQNGACDSDRRHNSHLARCYFLSKLIFANLIQF